MALSPTRVTLDFGTASRHVGDPVPYEHEFYRAVLRGLISLDLGSAGTFTYTDRSGFRNLDAVRIRIAEERLLEHLPKERAYRMPLDVRVRRCSTVLQGLGTLMGGAKLATHYTDVTPAALVLAVVKGGNNPFQYTVAAGTREPLRAEPKSLVQAIETWRDQLLSRVYLGWTAGFYDTVHETLLNGLAKAGLTREVVTGHPRRVLGDLAADLASRSGEWLG